MRWAGHVARIGGAERCIQGLGGGPEEQRPLGRPRCRCENNITTGLQEVGWGAWTGLIWFVAGTGDGLLCMR